ncbi:aldolase/citrate lyase family protein [Pseudarthrobacter sp. fls2-241-R2A-168]|uniref:HpcH/HpaI aldolase family protein n=1 Tax=Pseudarthrobacter sp. fls2-241-R2A-168 TaxID=3040304 RepID=UPI0025535E4C|nr:aldolase/citrate lyase family protein [Pseudarthrobacter sp. fls2-241-R2A-168]
MNNFLKAEMEPALGGWIMSSDPDSARYMIDAGYKWLGIDEQHGNADRAAILSMLDQARAVKVPAYIRVAHNRPELIGAALDGGAAGVIVPQIESALQAREAASACRYPPRGSRSWGPRHVPYGGLKDEMYRTNESVNCIVMIESVAGLNAVSEIAEVDGIDGIFVGTMDLSIDAGTTVTEILDDTGEGSALTKARTAASDAGIVLGGFGGSATNARKLVGRGFQLVAVTTDTALLAAAVQSALKDASHS